MSIDRVLEIQLNSFFLGLVHFLSQNFYYILLSRQCSTAYEALWHLVLLTGTEIRTVYLNGSVWDLLYTTWRGREMLMEYVINNCKVKSQVQNVLYMMWEGWTKINIDRKR
jgi:hypothetical protein